VPNGPPGLTCLFIIVNVPRGVGVVGFPVATGYDLTSLPSRYSERVLAAILTMILTEDGATRYAYYLSYIKGVWIYSGICIYQLLHRDIEYFCYGGQGITFLDDIIVHCRTSGIF